MPHIAQCLLHCRPGWAELQHVQVRVCAVSALSTKHEDAGLHVRRRRLTQLRTHLGDGESKSENLQPDVSEGSKWLRKVSSRQRPAYLVLALTHEGMLTKWFPLMVHLIFCISPVPCLCRHRWKFSFGRANIPTTAHEKHISHAERGGRDCQCWAKFCQTNLDF